MTGADFRHAMLIACVVFALSFTLLKEARTFKACNVTVDQARNIRFEANVIESPKKKETKAR